MTPMTISKAAERYKGTSLTRSAIRRMIIEGVLPHTKVGNKRLVTDEAIQEWLRGDKHPGGDSDD